MTVINEITISIDSTQADRGVALSAGNQTAADAVFRELTQPLNQLRAQLFIDPKPDDEARQLHSATLDRGLAALAGVVRPEFLNHSTARADDVRLLAGAAARPRLHHPTGLPAEPPAPGLDTPTPAPDGAPGTFVSARRAAHLQIVYVDADGREVLREGGSRSWRNNNPGNIIKSNFADAQGAIGDDDTFAIFPSEGIGFDAIVQLLRTRTYGALSLEDAIARYAPPTENDTASYVAFVSSKTGIESHEILGDLGIDKIRAIARAIRSMEGWTEGAERRRGSVSGRGAPVPSPGLEVPGTGLVRPGITTARRAAEEWMGIARSQAALPARERTEWPDPEENPRILGYFRSAPWFEPGGGDETDWCAAFVNWALEQAGFVGTNHPGARSFFWNRQSQFVSLDAPAFGCIAVRRYAPFTDPSWPTGPGHVGLVVSWTRTTLRLLGGNQDKTVKEKDYLRETHDHTGGLVSRFVAFMMPVMN